MAIKSNNEPKLNLMLLKESLWKVEDKLNVILESIADHEAELIRLKRRTNLSLERIGKVETRLGKNIKGRAKNE